MATPRFYLDIPLSIGDVVALPPRAAHHANHVLRLREGEPVVVFNGRGGEYHGRLEPQAKIRLLRHDAAEREPSLRVTLVQSWIASDKLDWLVEKAVELGVAAIYLAPAHRSVVRLTPARRDKRIERLRELAIAACCQCGRNRIPTIDGFEDLEPALRAAAAPDALAALLAPMADATLVELVGSAANAITVAIGPEGGFDESEAALAQRWGYRACRLGPRVLRTETAGIAALAALQAVAGDFA